MIMLLNNHQEATSDNLHRCLVLPDYHGYTNPCLARNFNVEVAILFIMCLFSNIKIHLIF